MFRFERKVDLIRGVEPLVAALKEMMTISDKERAGARVDQP